MSHNAHPSPYTNTQMQYKQMPSTFTVCKIEAGRAVLLSQEDFELIEFPAKMLPKDCGGVVKIQIEKGASEEKDISLVSQVLDEFGVEWERVEGFKNEITSEGFLWIESLGCTAAILSWSRPFTTIFGPSVAIESVIMSVTCASAYEEEYVDFVMKGQKPVGAGDSKLRVNLPVDLEVALVVRTSVGCFRSNVVRLSCKKFEDFSGVFLVTDLQSNDTDTDNSTDTLLEFIREQGGYISRQFNADQPITAVVTDSFESPLFREGIESNLPVVGASWLEALVSTREIPHFEDHLIKRA